MVLLEDKVRILPFFVIKYLNDTFLMLKMMDLTSLPSETYEAQLN